MTPGEVSALADREALKAILRRRPPGDLGALPCKAAREILFDIERIALRALANQENDRG